MMPSTKRALCGLRRDLRLQDNAVLERATRYAGQVAVAFIYDTTILDRLVDKKDRRVAFIHQSIAELDQNLQKHGSHLWVRVGDPVIEIPKLAQELQADTIYAGRDFESEAIRRDQSIQHLELVKDQVVFQDKELLTEQGNPYTVFTPYSKAWLKRVAPDDIQEFQPDFSKLVQGSPQRLPTLEEIGFEAIDGVPSGGEVGSHARLKDFLNRIDGYAEGRDFPALNACSNLSVDFRFGTLSIREAFRMALDRPSEGAHKWVLELIWREFYQMILANFPHVEKGAFKRHFQDIEWPGPDEHFEAWRKGLTGFPIVDAAMRCLNATGAMHNRLRMIVASFLVKDLLIDWRRGERYFADKLLDFDLASNNGGWQWSASTGCDAQPYFRIFNPTLQSKKFDSEGRFIKHWIPELQHLDATTIHSPHQSVFCPPEYPKPIVEHSVQIERAKQLFQAYSS